MKKVMLIGSLMVLSGLPNIYASDTPMENENMSMESRDFPTITSVQRVFKDETVNPLGEQAFQIALMDYWDSSSSSRAITKIRKSLKESEQTNDFFILDDGLLNSFIKEIKGQEGDFFVDLLVPTSEKTYKLPLKVKDCINEIYRDTQVKRIGGIKALNDKIKDQQGTIARLEKENSEKQKLLTEKELEIKKKVEKIGELEKTINLLRSLTDGYVKEKLGQNDSMILLYTQLLNYAQTGELIEQPQEKKK